MLGPFRVRKPGRGPRSLNSGSDDTCRFRPALRYLTDVSSPSSPREMTVQLTGSEYDKTIQDVPECKLLYIDDDDGETVTVRITFDPFLSSSMRFRLSNRS